MILEKMPTLYSEANAAMQGASPEDLASGRKLEQLLEISMCTITDARMGDKHPFQAIPFSKGSDLVINMNRFNVSGGGGGNGKESYDLAIYYAARHIETPNVTGGVKPLLIIAGDEGFYADIHPAEITHHFGDTLGAKLKTADLLQELKSKYHVAILRPETSSYLASEYAAIHSQWVDALGEERVLRMDDPRRLVDCIIGLCASNADNIDAGMKMLRRRQTDAQVREVLKTLHPILGSTAGKEESQAPKRGGRGGTS